ncbi:hypothetical protein MMC07_009618 [Pseudocyphellaria aurata]|nr:hypothetical protein [Pseudocyphellaria aurata]
MTSESTPDGPLDVVSGRRARDLDLPPVAGLPKHLPNEVLLIIFSQLEKHQLKIVRCVCKLYARLASSFLFDVIYISPHRPNLDVFRKIAQHPELSQYPRTLIYYVQKFKEKMDPQEYYKDLCRQLHYFLSEYPKYTIQHVDTELQGLLRMAKGSPNPAKSNPEVYDDYSTCRIVKRGLEIYLEKAEEQQHYNSNGELLACLCIGLMRLIHVERVVYQHSWTDGHLRSIDWSKHPRDLRLASSPLARTWSPFHLQPSSPFTPITLEFDNVITAFSLTGRPLRSLDACSAYNVAYEIFQAKSGLSQTFCQHGFPAMYYLESLSLKVNMCRHSRSDSGDIKFEEPQEKTLALDLLAPIIHSMPGLRTLSLTGITSDSGNALIPIQELFHTFKLPALESLSLSGMLGSAAQISAFLRAQPRLRTLEFRAIELSEGTWVGLVDDMRKHLSLQSLGMELPLREDGGMDLWDEDSWDEQDFSEQIEDYVVNGGENPLRAPR